MTRTVLGPIALLSSLVVAGIPSRPALAQDQAPQPSAVETIQREARAVRPLVESRLATDFLDATANLPSPGPRVVYYNRKTRDAMTEAEAIDRGVESLEAEGYAKSEIPERFFYFTRYGTPIAYARAIDLAAKHGLESVDGKKVLDFGYGGIGHLRLLASLGAHVTGVEVDPLLKAVYSANPADTGAVPRAKIAGTGANGSITLLHGQFPKDQDLVGAVGGGHALLISKNVLKRGYIHPEREPASPQMLIDLGVDDDTFLRRAHDALAPGGLFVIYNFYPKPKAPDEPYIPWADGRTPFSKEAYERAGFEVLEYNRDDTPAAREVGAQLGWGASMDLQDDLFGMYTVARRRR